MWIQAGFSLQQLALFPRDYLLPSPASSLRVDHDGDEVRNRMWTSEPSTAPPPERGRAIAHSWDDPVLDASLRTNLSAVGQGVTGVRRVRQGLLGRVDRPGKRQVCRVSRTKITNMQKAVTRATQERVEQDPLGKDETKSQLGAYLSGLSVPSEEVNMYLTRLSPKNIPEIHRATQELQMFEVEEDLEEAPTEDPEEAEASPKVDRRKIENATRTAVKGENRKARREQIRSTLPDGFYICESGTRGVKTLHRLEHCEGTDRGQGESRCGSTRPQGRGKGSQAPALPAGAAGSCGASRRPVQRQRPWQGQSRTRKRKEHSPRSKHPVFQGAHFGEERNTSRVVPVTARSVLCFQREEMYRRSVHKAPCVRYLWRFAAVR